MFYYYYYYCCAFEHHSRVSGMILTIMCNELRLRTFCISLPRSVCVRSDGISKSFNRKSVGFSGMSREKETVVQQVVSRSTAVHAVMTTSGTSSFAVPAVPNSASVVDTTVGLADSTAVVYTDVILKKTGVKRACSDPGYQFSHR